MALDPSVDVSKQAAVIPDFRGNKKKATKPKSRLKRAGENNAIPDPIEHMEDASKPLDPSISKPGHKSESLSVKKNATEPKQEKLKRVSLPKKSDKFLSLQKISQKIGATNVFYFTLISEVFRDEKEFDLSKGILKELLGVSESTAKNLIKCFQDASLIGMVRKPDPAEGRSATFKLLKSTTIEIS